MAKKKGLSAETKSAQALRQIDAATGGITPAIHPSSTFLRDENYQLINARHSYGRAQNPGYDVAEKVLAELEGAPAALLFSSGMAAAMAVVQSLRPGDQIVAPKVMYWGLRNWLIKFCDNWGLGLDLFDAADPDALAKTVRKGKTKLVWIETPCNPTWDVIDIAAAAEIAHAAGAWLAADSTVSTPVLTQPIKHGADIVMHSATKYLNGHSDVVGGSIVAATTELAESLTWWANCLGITGAPFDSYLTLRGVRTLHARMRQHEDTANLLANVLEEHPMVDSVYYPGLRSHPGHNIAVRQQSGFGGMISFDISGGPAAVATFVDKLSYFSLAESLGGVESLVCHPASMTHAPVSADALQEAGIGQTLIRLSIGLECSEDLVADVLEALEAARLESSPAPVAALV